MNYFYEKFMGGKSGLTGFIILAAIILVFFPVFLDAFRLNLVGKYLTYAFPAVSLVLLWGYGGILSLGQGIFFGLGGYAMAMFLKLEASSPENTAIQTTPGIPDFMDWNQITELPWFWVPFESFTFTLFAISIEGTIPTKDGDIKPTCKVNIAPPMAEKTDATQKINILKLETS